MDKLDKHIQEKHLDNQEIVEKKKVDQHLGVGKRPHRGMRLWALDLKADKPEDRLYEVKLQDQKVVRMQKWDPAKKNNITQPKFKARINPNHKHVWALNRKSAIKKFTKKYAL